MRSDVFSNLHPDGGVPLSSCIQKPIRNIDTNLATTLNRTVRALKMKRWNLQHIHGQSGLPHCSKLDREVYNKWKHHWVD